MSALTQNIVSRLRLNPDSPFAKGLVGCWLMGNRACWRSNKLLDLSPYRNHGTLTNMDPQTDWVHDGERAGLDLSANNDYISLPNITIARDISISAIVYKIGTQPNWSNIVSQPYTSFTSPYYEYALTFNDAQGLRFIVASSKTNYANAIGSTVLPSNSWSLACGTYDGNYVRVYANGVLNDSATHTGNLAGWGQPLRFGDLGTAPGSYNPYIYLGFVLIHNRALSSAEVSQLYEETRDGSYGSLVLTDEGRRQTTTVFIPKVPDKPIMRDVVAQRVKTSDYLELNTDSPLTKGLVGCWLMGNRACWRSNKLLDLSPYRNHGVLTNMDPQTDWVHDGERAWLEFDGVDDYVVVPGDKRREHMPDLVSVVAWSIGDRTNDTEPIIVWDGGSADAYSLRFKDAGTSSLFGPTFGIMTSGGSYSAHETTNPLPDGPQFLVGTYDGSSVRLYRNGDEVASAVTDGTPITYSSFGNKGILIHARDPSVLLRGGKSDFILVYNRALSANEVKQLYNETKNGGYGSLVRQRSITHISEEPKYASSIRTSVPTIITSSKTRDNTARSLRLNPDSPFAKELVGCWLAGNPACKRSGKLLDLSPYRNHGTLTNMDPQTDWVHDGTRAGLDFDGSNDYITTSLTDDKKPSGAMTLTAWVRGRSSSSNSCGMGTMGFDGSRGFALAFDSGTTAHFWIPSSASSFVSVSLSGHNSARHTMYSGVFEPSTSLSLYRDGQLGATNTASVPAAQYTSNGIPFRIGVRGDTLAFFVGTIGLVTLHNRALTASEVAQLYHETKDGGYGTIIL